MAGKIAFKLNDKPVELDVDGDRKLLWVLRTELGLTGTKFSCGEGHCGSCTVLVNGVATRSCITKMKTLAGKEVVTIEGLARNGKLHPLQRAFMECDGFQCGFCTPGMIVTGAALLASNPRLTRDEILHGMEQNLCRCGAHARIVQAMEKAGQEMAGKGLGG
jgi:aerobic-type carbon monoxide dehydrogenase small subunit (CoxS/CutS family)